MKENASAIEESTQEERQNTSQENEAGKLENYAQHVTDFRIMYDNLKNEVIKSQENQPSESEKCKDNIDGRKEYSCVSGKIKEVYPIKTMSGEPTGHYGIIFEADSGQPGDGASEAYRGRDYSEFEAGQKVWHITYKRERLQTDEELKNDEVYCHLKEELDEALKNEDLDLVDKIKENMKERETVTDWVYVTVPYGANKEEYLSKALLADKREQEEREKRLTH